MDIPKQVTKNQSINYAKIAFCDLLNSANKDEFDLDTIDTFVLGAMEAHKKCNTKEFVEILKNEYKDKKFKIEIIDIKND